MFKRLLATFIFAVLLCLLFTGCKTNAQTSISQSISLPVTSNSVAGNEFLANEIEFPLDIRAEKKMIVVYTDYDVPVQTLLVEENGNELVNHKLQNSEKYYHSGGISNTFYAFCVIGETLASGEVAYDVIGGEYNQAPHTLYSGSAAPNLLPYFFVVDEKLHCSMGIKNEVTVWDLEENDSTTISRVLETQSNQQGITVLSSQPFYNEKQYGFFAETDDKAYFYILEKGIIKAIRPLRNNEKLLSAALLSDVFLACMQDDTQGENVPFKDELVANAFGNADTDLVRQEGSYYQIVSDGWGTALALNSYPMAEQTLCAVQTQTAPGTEVILTNLDLPEEAKPENLLLFCTGRGKYTIFDSASGTYHEFTIATLLEESDTPSVDSEITESTIFTENISNDIEIWDADSAQYQVEPTAGMAALSVWNGQNIPKLGTSNFANATFYWKDNTINILLSAHVSANTGSPEGWLVSYTVDLTKNKIVALRIEDYAGEVAEGESHEFPIVTTDELLEWARMFYDAIIELA